jgi:hypothetical protein
MKTNKNFFVLIGLVLMELLFILGLINLTYSKQGYKEEDSCLWCHSNATKMKEFGFPQFTVTSEEVMAQTKMPATCTDCHLGNPNDKSKEGAHKGLLRLYVIIKKNGFQALTRDKLKRYTPDSLQPNGGNPQNALLPKIEINGTTKLDPEVVTILYHDKDPIDFSFNYLVIEKTCGKCHPEEVKEFKKTPMGQNSKQRQYKSWIDKEKGPHNCGSWFIEGFEEIAKNTKVPYTKEMAMVNQKACNWCHTQCLDCHYTPKRRNIQNISEGPHTFTKQISPITCYGGGRGSICHAGPEDRRRGAGYIGGDFSNPRGATPDVHYIKGITCVECHENASEGKKLFHGHFKRQVNCSKCHAKEVKSLNASIHKKLTCEACHIQNIGGYAGTFWGPGKMAGVKTPFFKYKEYYGIVRYPILIKDQHGRWIPVKPYPMAVLNQKTSGDLKPGLAWRFPKNLPDLERTDDAWAFVGLLGGLPSNDYALAWIQMDKLSHKYGRARPCESCHTLNGEQRQEIYWKYTDAGAEPFEGGYLVIANKEVLFIKNIHNTTEIKVKEGWRIEDFAPWFYLKDEWKVKGDFSIPMIKNKKLYQKELVRYLEVVNSGKSYHN